MPNDSKSGVYQSPLNRLFIRQQPKVKAKKGMANLLLAYAENDSKRIGMGQKGWELVHEKFHYTRLVKDMKNLYNDLLL
jgi:hypothetical protein